MVRSVDGRIYKDKTGKVFIKIRDVGYSLYGYQKEDGSYGYCGGIGPGDGLEIIEYPTQEDKKAKRRIEKAPFIPLEMKRRTEWLV